MNVIIFFGGNYKGHSASASRTALYVKGLTENGIGVKVISNYKPLRGRLAHLLWTYISPLSSCRTILKQPADDAILLVYASGWVKYIFIWIAARLRKMKFVVEVNEKPYTPYGSWLSEIKFLKWINSFMHRHIAMKLPDGFIAISKNLEDYLKENGRSEIVKIPIIIDPSAGAAESSKLENVQKPFLLHAGALSEQKDGIVGVFEAFAIANTQLGGELYFYLTDKVAPQQTLTSIRQIVKEYNLEKKVIFLGLIPKADLLAYQKECSMLILNKPDNEQNKYNFSTKLGEYLILGKPVIYTPVGEMDLYLKDNYNAFKVPEGDSRSLAEAIVKIIANKNDEVKEIGLKGKELAGTEFNYHYQGGRLAEFLKKIHEQ
ncbi:MAG: glycosyltransferase [Ferruginibacter sp.]